MRLDSETGALILIAIHSERLGPASGGTRMALYPDREAAIRDAMRLSAGMTYKWAAADFPRGGGKAVIAVPAELEPRARSGLLHRYGELIQELSGRFWTGADVGTSSKDMDVIAETGAPYVFSRTPERGGAGGSETWTGMGVFAAIETVCLRLFGDKSIRGRRVLVQGAGSVGASLIERLVATGAEVSFSDIRPASIARFREKEGLPFVDPGAVWDAPCDLFAPCALGAVLNAQTIPRLRCLAVVGAANNQLAESEDAARLRARRILYAPDFVVNAGGAIAITGQEALGWTAERARGEVLRIGATLGRIFDLAAAEGITPDAAARRIAEQRLAAGPEAR
jgi:leucine dehydrogenase